MEKLLIILCIIVISSSLVSCSSNNRQEKIYEHYSLIYEEVRYQGYIDSVRKENYILEGQSSYEVHNGDYIKAGSLLLTSKNNSDEMEKINNQINNITTDIQTNEKTIKEKKIGLRKNDLNDEIKQLQKENTDFKRQIAQYKLDLVNLKKQEVKSANFSGQIIISDETATLYSTEMQIIYNSSQNQLDSFNINKEYIVILDEKEIGVTKLKYIIPNDELTDKGNTAYYKVVFELPSQDTLRRNKLVTIIDKNTNLFIPKSYVKESEGKTFIKIENNEKEVNLKKIGTKYMVINGLKEKDILESYIVTGKNND